MTRRWEQSPWHGRLACVRTAERAATRVLRIGSVLGPRQARHRLSWDAPVASAPRGRRATGVASFPRGFTLVELLVSVGVLVMALFALAAIFEISSETTGRTVAHAELMEISAAVQQRIADQLGKMQPGLLIIDCPAPTSAKAEIHGGPALFRVRQDHIVFLALGGPGQFQSFTDPTAGTPTNPALQPAASREALVYFGPGIPLDDSTHQPRSLTSLTASEWVLAHRSILLLLSDPLHAGWSPLNIGVITAGGGLLNGGRLQTAAPDIWSGRIDAVVSGTASGSTMILDQINAKPLSDIITANPSIAGLWDPNAAPTSVNLANTAAADYYVRGGFTLQPRLADFRIEWTDGVTNSGAPDFGTRWFGLRPDGASPLTDVNTVLHKAQCRKCVASAAIPSAEEDERLAFQTQIEWTNPPGGGSDANAAYRAIWRTDTWGYRPKALRFTYRLYDAGNRLKQATSLDLDDDGTADRLEAGTMTPHDAARFGQEFSFVVPIP